MKIARFLNWSRTEQIVFYALLAANLLPLWTSEFFVTGDGPCHLHNSRVLLDWMRGEHRAFYDGFYFLNTNFDPNWLSHLALANLMRWFEPPLAEKILLTVYVLLFGFGWRYLIRAINPQSLFLSALGLLFVWHHVLMMGFYNYSFSIALFFWVLGYWLRRGEAFSFSNLFALAGLFLALYAAHPAGLSLSWMAIGSILLVQFLGARNRLWPERLQTLKRRAGVVALAALPAGLLLLEYLFRHGFHVSDKSIDLATLWDTMREMRALTTMNFRERDAGMAVLIFCTLTFCMAIFYRLRPVRAQHPCDGLFLFFSAVLVFYFRQPEAMASGTMVPQRLVFVPVLAALLWAVTANFPRWFQMLGLLAALVFTSVFLVKRLPAHWQASDLAAEIAACRAYIPDESVVLPLSVNKNGLTPDGRTIGDRIYLFAHVADYLGAYRSVVMADNYEAIQWFFPFRWQREGNLYNHTSKKDNLESLPPRALFLEYRNTRNSKMIDYVLLMHYRASDWEHEYGREIKAQLDAGYVEAYRSASGRVVLYRRKTR